MGSRLQIESSLSPEHFKLTLDGHEIDRIISYRLEEGFIDGEYVRRLAMAVDLDVTTEIEVQL